MFQKFFTKTIESKFIKNLLYNTALPIYKTVRRGDYLFKDNIYINSDTLIKCTKSGQLDVATWHIYNIDSALGTTSFFGQQVNYMQPIIEEHEIVGGKNIIQYSDAIKAVPDGFRLVNPRIIEITSETTLAQLKGIITGKYFILDDNSDTPYFIKAVEGVKDSNIYCETTSVYAIKGEYIADISDANKLLYPTDDRQGSYWYTKYNNSVRQAEYEVIMYNYEFGKLYDQFTERYISEFGYYDSGTHEQLGKYLRCIRDLYNLDLMPFYNCYSNRTARNFYINKSEVPYEEAGVVIGKIPTYELVNASKSDYKVLQVPIRFNKTYSIYIDADSEVWMVPAVIKNDRFVTVYDTEKKKIDLTEALHKSVIIKQGTQFKHPFTYKLDLTDDTTNAKYLALNEDNLYLLIQLPSTNTSSVLVLESDGNSFGYTKAGITKYYENSAFSEFSPQQKDYLFLSALALTKLNDRVNYAFSDKLIEYLTLNVITPLETIDANIERVQDALGFTSYDLSYEGIWNENIRKYCYEDIMNNKKIEHYDLTGYVDKVIEKNILSKGN